MPKLLRKLAGFGIGLFVFLACSSVSIVLVGSINESQVAANKAAWGSPVACPVSNPRGLHAVYSTSVLQVDMVCPSFSQTILVAEQDSHKPTNVWINAQTGQVFIANDRNSGGGNTINREPPVGTLWPLALLLLIPLSLFIGLAVWFYFNQWKDWSVRAEAA